MTTEQFILFCIYAACSCLFALVVGMLTYDVAKTAGWKTLWLVFFAALQAHALRSVISILTEGHP